jgi:hypothetical protein
MLLVTKVVSFLLELFLINGLRRLAAVNPERSFRFYLAYCWMALLFYLLSIPLMIVGVLVGTPNVWPNRGSPEHLPLPDYPPLCCDHSCLDEWVTTQQMIAEGIESR